jgi:hypothetical protein
MKGNGKANPVRGYVGSKVCERPGLPDALDNWLTDSG